MLGRDRAGRGRRPAPALILAAALAAVPAGPRALAGQVPDADRCDWVSPAMAPLHLDPFRQAELRGSVEAGPIGTVRGSTRRLTCHPEDGDEPTLRLLPVLGGLQNNSAYPRLLLNGLRWAGRGLSAELGGGVTGRWGPVSAAFAPRLSYQENRPFPTLDVTLPGHSPHAWFWLPNGIDWPQRFGTESFWWAHPGESYIRVDAYGAALGFSTETLRWGPSRRNPLIMSAGAPGFPHVFLGTSGPVNVGIGSLAVEATWGHLAESDYFDGNTDNDTRVFAGLVAALELRWVPGLTLGLSRAYARTLPPGGWPLIDYITEPYDGLFTNTIGGDAFEAENDMASIFARWLFPDVELEIYGEFARDDLWDGSTHLLMAPEHSGALSLGLQKLLRVSDEPDDARRVRLAAEMTSLNISDTQRAGTWDVLFYTHNQVIQGHTHRGQILGAPIGPSSDAQSLELDFLADSWLAGIHVERVRYANDVYYAVHGIRYGYKGHDVEVTGGLRGALRLEGTGLALTGDVSWSGRYNRGFVVLRSNTYQLGYERNFSVQLGASWRPASGRIGLGGGRGSPSTRP